MDAGYVVLAAENLAVIAAFWSLCMFRGWRITAPASRKNSAPAVVADSGHGENATAGAVQMRGGKAA